MAVDIGYGGFVDNYGRWFSLVSEEEAPTYGPINMLHPGSIALLDESRWFGSNDIRCVRRNSDAVLECICYTQRAKPFCDAIPMQEPVVNPAGCWVSFGNGDQEGTDSLCCHHEAGVGCIATVPKQWSPADVGKPRWVVGATWAAVTFVDGQGTLRECESGGCHLFSDALASTHFAKATREIGLDIDGAAIAYTGTGVLQEGRPGPFKEVARSPQGIACGIRMNGTLECWDPSGEGATLVPPGDEFIRVHSSSATSFVGLTAKGEQVLFSANGSEVRNPTLGLVPAPLGSCFSAATGICSEIYHYGTSSASKYQALCAEEGGVYDLASCGARAKTKLNAWCDGQDFTVVDDKVSGSAFFFENNDCGTAMSACSFDGGAEPLCL